MIRLSILPGRQSAAICAAVLAAGLLASTAHAKDYSRSFTIATRATVHINTNDGSVKVTPGDARQVEIHVDYHGYDEGKSLHIESHQNGDVIELTARTTNSRFFFFGALRDLTIEVRMPKDSDLKVDTGDGPIHASGLTGNVDLHSGDGNLTVSAVSGVLRLHTGDGGIEGRDLDGQCDADSGDGHIKLAGRFDVLRAKSGDGKIEISAAHGSRMESSWNVQSGDGGLEVALPADFRATVQASTGDGHISTELPITVTGNASRTRVQGTLNGGGQSLTVHTGDGSIRLTGS